MAKKLKTALLGFGGMGHFHASQYKDQPNCELIAICDIDKKQFEKLSAEINLGNSGQADLAGVKQYLSYEELIKNERPDIIDICLPCHLHAEYAIRAMNDGFNVLCEKPMARNVKLADKMIETSKKTGKKLMIAQCLRFESIYNALRDAYKSKKYGKLLRMDMRRVGGAPGASWYRDVKCSGGALLDLHLHDTDFIQYMLGTPEAVQTYGVTRVSGGIDDSITNYFFPNGPHVSSEGSWCRTGWYCSTAAIFEKATLEICGNTLKIIRLDKPMEEKDFSKNKNGYWNEINYFAECVRSGKDPEQCLPEHTRESIRIACMEEKSALSGRKQKL